MAMKAITNTTCVNFATDYSGDPYNLLMQQGLSSAPLSSLQVTKNISLLII